MEASMENLIFGLAFLVFLVFVVNKITDGKILKWWKDR